MTRTRTERKGFRKTRTRTAWANSPPNSSSSDDESDDDKARRSKSMKTCPECKLKVGNRTKRCPICRHDFEVAKANDPLIAAKNKERRAAERAYVNELFEEFLAKRRVRVCSICLDKPLTHAVMPCGHKCMCGDCADKLTSKVCPICKDEYIKIGQIYEC